jgi:antitoxin PrlF
MKAVLSEKGQVTIPKPLRDRLGLRTGQTLEFREAAGKLVVEKAETQDPVAAVYGILKLGCGTDQAMAELRGGLEK